MIQHVFVSKAENTMIGLNEALIYALLLRLNISPSRPTLVNVPSIDETPPQWHRQYA